jgi:hypothetical protein
VSLKKRFIHRQVFDRHDTLAVPFQPRSTNKNRYRCGKNLYFVCPLTSLLLRRPDLMQRPSLTLQTLL